MDPVPGPVRAWHPADEEQALIVVQEDLDPSRLAGSASGRRQIDDLAAVKGGSGAVVHDALSATNLLDCSDVVTSSTTRSRAGGQRRPGAVGVRQAQHPARRESAGPRVGGGRSTAHRIIWTLVQEGLLEKVEDTGLFRLTTNALPGASAETAQRLHEAATIPLDRLRALTDGTLHVGILDGPDVLYVERRSSS